MENGGEGKPNNGENFPRADEGKDFNSEISGSPEATVDNEFRKAIENMDRRMRPFQEMQEKILSTMDRSSAVQKAMENSLEPHRNLHDRMKNLGLLAGKDSPLGRVAEQISAQQGIIDSIRFSEPEIPRLPPIPPNPILETNKRLERIEDQFERMQSIATNAAEIVTGLQGAAAEFLQKFEDTAAENDRSTKSAIRIGKLAIIIAVAMPAIQIIYSEYRREPSNDANVQTTLESVRAELSAMRNEQDLSSNRLNEAFLTSHSETAGILLNIQNYLSQMAEPPTTAVEQSAPTVETGLAGAWLQPMIQFIITVRMGLAFLHKF